MKIIKTSEFVKKIAEDEEIEVSTTQLAMIENYASFMRLKPTIELIRAHFEGVFSDDYMNGFKPEQYDTVEDCMIGFELKNDSAYNWA